MNVRDDIYGDVTIHPYPEDGAWFGVFDGRLVYAPMNVDGTPDLESGLGEPEYALIDPEIAERDAVVLQELLAP